jgi:nucleoside phosphorylase
VGWIAVLHTEEAAAIAILDVKHKKPYDFEKSDADENSYTWGRVGIHNVIITRVSNNPNEPISAFTTAKVMAMSFPIRFAFLVGIGGGIPRLRDELDVRLGNFVARFSDLAISMSVRNREAQYNGGRATANRFVLQDDHPHTTGKNRAECDIINSFPCLVVRGICDNASAKQKDWWDDRRLAHIAAVLIRELLCAMEGGGILQAKTAKDLLGGGINASRSN